MINPDSPPITIRPAHAEDAVAIASLADLDSAAIPQGPLIVAEIDGELRVALSARDGTVIADPFHRTLELSQLMRDLTERTGTARSPRHRLRTPAGLLRVLRLRPA